MHASPAIMVFLQVLTALGSAFLSICILAARTEAAVAREREALADSKAALSSAEAILAERIRAVEQEAKRNSIEELMSELRVEERHRAPEEAGAVRSHTKTLILQERLYFRNIPLSGWVESAPIRPCDAAKAVHPAVGVFHVGIGAMSKQGRYNSGQDPESAGCLSRKNQQRRRAGGTKRRGPVLLIA